MPKPSTFIPIAPHPGTPLPSRHHRPQCVVGSGQTTRTRGPTGRFASLAGPVDRLCSLCGRTETSQWRTGQQGQTLCNACGIRLNRKPSSKSSSSRKQKSSRTDVKVANPTLAKITSVGNNPLRFGTGSEQPKRRQDAYRLENILNPQ